MNSSDDDILVSPFVGKEGKLQQTIGSAKPKRKEPTKSQKNDLDAFGDNDRLVENESGGQPTPAKKPKLVEAGMASASLFDMLSQEEADHATSSAQIILPHSNSDVASESSQSFDLQSAASEAKAFLSKARVASPPIVPQSSPHGQSLRAAITSPVKPPVSSPNLASDTFGTSILGVRQTPPRSSAKPKVVPPPLLPRSTIAAASQAQPSPLKRDWRDVAERDKNLLASKAQGTKKQPLPKLSNVKTEPLLSISHPSKYKTPRPTSVKYTDARHTPTSSMNDSVDDIASVHDVSSVEPLSASDAELNYEKVNSSLREVVERGGSSVVLVSSQSLQESQDDRPVAHSFSFGSIGERRNSSLPGTEDIDPSPPISPRRTTIAPSHAMSRVIDIADDDDTEWMNPARADFRRKLTSDVMIIDDDENRGHGPALIFPLRAPVLPAPVFAEEDEIDLVDRTEDQQRALQSQEDLLASQAEELHPQHRDQLHEDVDDERSDDSDMNLVEDDDKSGISLVNDSFAAGTPATRRRRSSETMHAHMPLDSIDEFSELQDELELDFLPMDADVREDRSAIEDQEREDFMHDIQSLTNNTTKLKRESSDVDGNFLKKLAVPLNTQMFSPISGPLKKVKRGGLTHRLISLAAGHDGGVFRAQANIAAGQFHSGAINGPLAVQVLLVHPGKGVGMISAACRVFAPPTDSQSLSQSTPSTHFADVLIKYPREKLVQSDPTKIVAGTLLALYAPLHQMEAMDSSLKIILAASFTIHTAEELGINDPGELEDLKKAYLVAKKSLTPLSSAGNRPLASNLTSSINAQHTRPAGLVNLPKRSNTQLTLRAARGCTVTIAGVIVRVWRCGPPKSTSGAATTDIMAIFTQHTQDAASQTPTQRRGRGRPPKRKSVKVSAAAPVVTEAPTETIQGERHNPPKSAADASAAWLAKELESLVISAKHPSPPTQSLRERYRVLLRLDSKSLCELSLTVTDQVAAQFENDAVGKLLKAHAIVSATTISTDDTLRSFVLEKVISASSYHLPPLAPMREPSFPAAVGESPAPAPDSNTGSLTHEEEPPEPEPRTPTSILVVYATLATPTSTVEVTDKQYEEYTSENELIASISCVTLAKILTEDFSQPKRRSFVAKVLQKQSALSELPKAHVQFIVSDESLVPPAATLTVTAPSILAQAIEPGMVLHITDAVFSNPCHSPQHTNANVDGYSVVEIIHVEEATTASASTQRKSRGGKKKQPPALGTVAFESVTPFRLLDTEEVNVYRRVFGTTDILVNLGSQQVSLSGLFGLEPDHSDHSLGEEDSSKRTKRLTSCPDCSTRLFVLPMNFRRFITRPTGRKPSAPTFSWCNQCKLEVSV